MTTKLKRTDKVRIIKGEFKGHEGYVHSFHKPFREGMLVYVSKPYSFFSYFMELIPMEYLEKVENNDII